MGTKSRENIYGGSVRAASERATEARKEADRLAVEAWNKRMLGFQGTGTAIADDGRRDQRRVRLSRSEMSWLQHAPDCCLDIVRRPKATPIHTLERYMRCKHCSQVRGFAYKRSHLVALRGSKISASDPPSTWWPGERD